MKMMFTSSEVLERVDRLPLKFNKYGVDPYGISRQYVAWFYSFLEFFYRKYFRVQVQGIHNVPTRGRVMVVGNHSGGLPFDGGMVMASLFLEVDPPRIAHGMVEKFAQRWPIVSQWFNRVGQFTGLPEHAKRLLEEERLLLVFPEGARGIGKLHHERYQLKRFGTGFIRLALQTQTPILPFAFVGGEEAMPTYWHLKRMAKLTGAPYWPAPPYLLPIPMPLSCDIIYGEPMLFEGDGTEDDGVIKNYVGQVKAKVVSLMERGLAERGGVIPKQPMQED